MDKLSYALGLNIGHQLKDMGLSGFVAMIIEKAQKKKYDVKDWEEYEE